MRMVNREGGRVLIFKIEYAEVQMLLHNEEGHIKRIVQRG